MTISFNQLGPLAVLALCLAASGFDVATRRIPNALTLGGAVAALAFHFFTGGAPALGSSLLGLTVGLLIFFPLFALGGLGAGDVKLLACLGAWLGPAGAVWTAMYAAIAGGVLAVIVMMFRGYVREGAANIRLLLTHWRVVGLKPLPELTLQHGRGPRLAYALPIAAGALVTLWLR